VYSLLKKLIKSILPQRLLLNAEPQLRKIVSAFFIGNNYECPVCGFHARKLIPVHEGESYLCPRCGSVERKRLLWLYLQNEIKIPEQQNFRVLHFSPSTALYRKLKTMKNIEYVPSAFGNPLIKNQFDITSLSLPDNHFDLIICYHILEHVPDDRRAMNELFRVVKKGGVALLQVPYSDGQTIEDSSVTTAEERKKLFGQEDHVRYYGREDFTQRLKASGFSVEEIDYAQKTGKENSRLYKLRADEIIFRCVKS
jgi:SAM-dependent methyltransferase